jgi:hypothetical protein
MKALERGKQSIARRFDIEASAIIANVEDSFASPLL